MEEQLLSFATEHGIWSLLSMALLIYILKKQEARDTAQAEREEKYQTLLSELAQKFDIVEDIKADVTTIKERIENAF